VLRVYTPGGTGAEEIEKTIERCRAAEKRVKELEAGQSPPKRAKPEAQRRPAPRQEDREIEVGSWVRMPKLSVLREAARSPDEAEFSQLVGQVTAVGGVACTVRFSGVETKTYVETGRKVPSADYKDVKIPLATPFKCVYTASEAKWALSEQERYSVFAAVRNERQRKLRAARKAAGRASPARAESESRAL